ASGSHREGGSGMVGTGRGGARAGRALRTAVAAGMAIPVLALGSAQATTGGEDRSLPRASVNVARVNALVHAMTLDEKISLLTGSPGAGVPDPSSVGPAGFLPGVPRLGRPAPRL